MDINWIESLKVGDAVEVHVFSGFTMIHGVQKRMINIVRKTADEIAIMLDNGITFSIKNDRPLAVSQYVGYGLPISPKTVLVGPWDARSERWLIEQGHCGHHE